MKRRSWIESNIIIQWKKGIEKEMEDDMKKIAGFLIDNSKKFIGSIDSVAKAVGQTSDINGWHDDAPLRDPDLTYYKAAKLSLIHSEVSEALEELRIGNPEGEEIADVIIRCLDYCYEQNIPIGDMIIEKMLGNLSRMYKHGGKKL